MTTSVAKVFLVFQLADERYALDVQQVAEVLPLLNLKRIPQAPTGVAGLFDYRGTPVPVIDLSEVILGRPAQRSLSTRIVLAHFTDEYGSRRLLGLIAEKATETMKREDKDFAPSGLDNENAAYLGPVCKDARGVVRWVDVDRLLPPDVAGMLFRTPAES